MTQRAGRAADILFRVSFGSALTFSPLLAQDKPPDLHPPQATVRVETRLVIVDVVVKDKQGRPVKGLTREDFRLEEDGQPQEIAVFAWEGGPGAPEAAPPSQSFGTLPPDVFTNHPAYHAAREPLTIVLLDALNTPRADQVLMREEVSRYLTAANNHRQWVAILGLSDKLHVLQDFTTDPERLLAAVADYEPPASGLQGIREEAVSPATRDEHTMIREMIKACGGAAQCVAMQRFYESLKSFEEIMMAASDRMRMELTLAALGTLGRSLAGYPGRKNLIWVSAAFPLLSPGGQSDRGGWSGSEAVAHTSQVLNDARVAIYPVDPRGLAHGFQEETLEELRERMGGIRPRETGAGGSTTQAIMPSANVRHPLHYLNTSQAAMKSLAEATGGEAFYNRNDIAEAVEVAVAEGSSYYELGYYSKDDKWEGEFRRLEVKLAPPEAGPARKGLKVRHRQGYYAVPRPADSLGEDANAPRAEEELLTAMGDAWPATGIVFRAKVPQTADSSPDSGEVAAELWLEAETLYFQRGAEGERRVSLDCVAGAYSAAGEPLGNSAGRVQWSLNAAEYARVRQTGILVPLKFTLPAEAREVRLLVRDNYSGRLGRVDVPLPAEPPQAD